MRFPQIIATGFLALAFGGCASRPAPAPEPIPVEVPPPPVASIDEVRDRYFAAVRAYVREDWDEARMLLEQCRDELEPALAGDGVAPTDEREAQSLLAKSDYFLRKMEDQAVAALEAPVVEPPEPSETLAAPSTWEVTRGSIEPVHNKDVERWLRYFTGDGRDVYQKWLNRRSKYEALYAEIFAEFGLPPELIYHSMIESGFSTGAYSWAHAVGLWQFIRSTGRNYGLRADWWVDERRDPRKSTIAACRYLSDLHEEFGDWELALAAYNVGEVKIRGQIRRQKTRDFWKLRLPRETRNHIPKFYAALILGTNPEKYGFRVEETPQVRETETILVDFCVDFEVLGECAGVSAQTLAELNPSLVRRCTPPDESGFEVLVPAGTAARATTALAGIPEDQRIRWAHHRVRRGETLSHIADRYRTSVYAIAEANNLRNRHMLSIGQDLLIPQGRPSGANPPRYASSGSSSRSSSSSVPAGREKITYVVRKGDTLSEIADRHGTSSRMLRRWNRVGRYIYPGDRLTIYAKGQPTVASGSGGYTVKVRRGDTLWDLARHHGVSLNALLAANGLNKRSTIRPGDVLKVPPRKS